MSVPGNMLDVKFNPSKFCQFTVGKDYNDQLASLHFGDGNVSWSDSIKYLRIHFMSNKRLKIDMCSFLRKFAIITDSKYVNEDVKLRLFESFSLPLLTYGLNVIHLSAGQLNKLNIAWNNV